QIVTGANNMTEGNFVAVDKHGATLPVGKIKKGKLRGVDSFAMMCSEDELGLQQERAAGIMVWQSDTPLGIDIKEFLGLNESVIEFEITTNRPDCLSIIGLARETAATFSRQFNLKSPVVTESDGDIKDFISVDVENAMLCPRYSCRVIKNIKIGPSPEWMQRRLEMCGIRAINNIVDITNYVMLEYGQPMHAFNLRMIEGGNIIVRTAKKGETMTTLDGEVHTLDENMLVIADSNKPVALAGIMGGENSEIRDDTTQILFESANFNALSVRTTAKKLGMRTESSALFEKGLDVKNTAFALNRACELVCELGVGEVVAGMQDVCAPLNAKKEITLNAENINTFLGTKIDKDFMMDSLKALGFEVNNDIITVPSYRGDVESEADIAEEIARIYGYNNIPSVLNMGETTLGGKNEKQTYVDMVKDVLTSLGYFEIVTYSLVSPKVYEQICIEKDDYIEITNPLGEELSIMRTNAISSALEALAVNYNRRVEEAFLFELATTYHKGGNDGLAIEKQQIVLATYGNGADFYDIKGAVEQLLEAFGITYYDIEPYTDNTFHSGQTAIMSIKRQPFAIVGRIHPTVQKNFEIGTNCYVAVIDFDLLFENKRPVKKYKPLPKYPAIIRDIAVLVPEEVNARQIEDIFNKSKGGIMEQYSLFDVYRGEQIKNGCKSVAYSLTFRAADRTLKDEEVNTVMDIIIEQLKQKLSAELRL
ncbi:MAG: phenylalanine--tRNA ligase subunit beta, partial [Clostridiaceae bacterium]|nr:phenylalanine--tRNA ligase subunit beta [Clostridiaceae bacterium]